ncbi:MAG: XTP/dITP diphosphatase [Syntrophomonadaceae bacterium]|jgi:XTP/dITP diphosphohydrolase
MSNEILLATHNRNKIKEIEHILKDLDMKVLSLDDIKDIPAVEEDGDTFTANACKKAQLAAIKTGYTSLADDSGLVVDVLGGQPGIYSARFAGEEADDAKNNQKLLQMMTMFNGEERKARFVCVIAISDPEGNIQTAEGECQGWIGYEERGTGGFGYDPLFIPCGYNKTLAELGSEEKNMISHRAKALVKAKELLKKILCQ